jgi:hypothetical protein
MLNIKNGGYKMRKLRYEPGYHGDKLEDISSISYGDLTEDKEGDLLEVPYTMHSDYSGGTVECANCKAFLELYEDLPGVWEVSGGYGTTGVVILKSLYEENEEVKETIDNLADYPLIDEEALSELEMELEQEDWESWIKSDLKHELDKLQIGYPRDDETFFETYRAICDKHNIYWEAESAIGGYIRIADIVKHWEDDTTRDSLAREDLLLEYRNGQFTALLFFDQTPREFSQYKTPVEYKVLWEGSVIASGNDFMPYPSIAISENLLIAQLIDRCLWHVHSDIYRELSTMRQELLRAEAIA